MYPIDAIKVHRHGPPLLSILRTDPSTLVTDPNASLGS
jgi:hypothetical protein